MTPKEQAAMQQALEALDCWDKAGYVPFIFARKRAIATLREVLAEQAEQRSDSEHMEPVAWYLDTFDEDGELEDREYNGINEFSFGRGNGTPLYAAPVRTKDLTDDEVIEICKEPATSPCNPWWLKDDVVLQDVRDAAMRFARAVIAADRSKNK